MLITVVLMAMMKMELVQEHFQEVKPLFSAGYATQIGYSDFYVGANLKLISSKLEQYNSLGIAADIGFIYINEYLNFNAAFVIRNFGTQLTTYAGTKESLPFEVDLGFSQKLENVPLRWHVTFENLQQWPIASAKPCARDYTDLNGTQTPEEKVGFLQ